jgi:serine/threonine-protein kinase
MQHDDLCEPAMLNKSIPAHVSRVIMEGMNLSGRDRIQTITELVTRLFEQPAAVKPAFEQAHSDSYQNEPVRQTQPAYQQTPPPQPVQQQYYDQQQYRQQPQQQYYPPEDDYEEYSYEKVNTVDRIKVPIIIGILLLAILLIIVVFFMKAFGSGGDDESEFFEVFYLK